MTNDDIKKFRGVVKEEIETALKPIDTRLGRVEHKLDVLWEQTEELTKDMENVKETLDYHTKVLKKIADKAERNSDNIHRLNKRMSTIEDQSGVIPPPEFTI